MRAAAISVANQPVALQETISPGTYLPLSAALKVSETWVLKVKKTYVERDQEPWKSFDLSCFCLPPSPFNSQTIQLTQRPKFCMTIVMAIDTYLIRNERSKSIHDQCSHIVRALVKLFEYSWLIGLYDLSDWSQFHWDELKQKLAIGLWDEALDLEARSFSAVKNLTATQISAFLSLKKARGQEKNWGLSASFLKTIGTNTRLSASATILRAVLVAKSMNGDQDLNGSATVEKTFSSSTLQGILTHLAIVSELSPPYGWSHIDTSGSYKFAGTNPSATSRPAQRTPSMSPESVSAILTEAFRWVLEYGPIAIQMLKNLCRECAPHASRSVAEKWRKQAKVLLNCKEARELDALLGIKLTTYSVPKGDGASVSQLINKLQTSCFAIIAIMNARRKDEIGGKAVGLHTTSMTVLDRELGLYECLFYIEKTTKDYVPFLINNITMRAISLLEEVSEIAWEYHELCGGKRIPEASYRDRKLFFYPSFSNKQGIPSWYEFSTNKGGMARAFFVDVREEDWNVLPRAHMFRRAYALHFHYRFSLGTLQALSQQMGHRDTLCTLHYIHDAEATALHRTGASMWSIAPALAQKAQQEHFREISEEVAAVGLEKLRQLIAEIVGSAKSFSGGYAKLVRRFHSKMSRSISYQRLELDQQICKLQDALVARGHRSSPYKHGDCNSPGVNGLARCYSSDELRLRKEDASPALCDACSFHDRTLGHVRGLQEDLSFLETEVGTTAASTVLGMAKVNEIANLRRIIYLSKMRLGGDL